MSELELEDRISATLGRMADIVPPSRGDVADIRDRVIRRRRSVTVALCTVSAVAVIAVILVAR